MIDLKILFLIVFYLYIAGIVLTMFIPESSSPKILALFGTIVSFILFFISINVLIAGNTFHVVLWTIPELGVLKICLDRLSAFFLLVTSLIFLPVSIFSYNYLERYLHHYSLKVFNFLYLTLLVTIVLLLLAGDVISFLLSWEIMSILSYLLVNFEYRKEKSTNAGYLMLSMGEAGTIAIVFAFLLLAVSAGSVDFSTIGSIHQGLNIGLCWTVFLLSFFGFGIKAGLVPFNAWLPRAHPVAPGNISALLSGVILNLGIYGLMRVNMNLLPITLLGPGIILLLFGTISAFIGILYAMTENDMKVMLAHSSIENMGLITAGLGAGFIFIDSGHPIIAAIAFTAAFYQIINHSLYKTLLFLGSSTIDYRTGTRNMDIMGGLIRKMPWTTIWFLIGALSISAIPPFNGFVSEWLILQSILRSVELSSIGIKLIFALCGAGLALTLALAITCFLKAFSMGFLGISRSHQVEQSTEAPFLMISSMGLLAGLCLLLGILPTFIIPILNSVIKPFTQASAVNALIPPFFAFSAAHAQLSQNFIAEFHSIGSQVGQQFISGRGLVILHRGGVKNPVVFAMSTSYMFPVILCIMAITFFIVRFGLARKRSAVRRQPWSGGIQNLLPKMTYTATGFSNPVRVIFNSILRPKTQETQETVHTHFRTIIRYNRKEVHIIERLLIIPLWSGILKIAYGLSSMHRGKLNTYAAYILLILILVLILVILI